MWRYECPCCKQMIENPDIDREKVRAMATKLITCPKCGEKIYVVGDGSTVDIAGAVVNFFRLNGGLELTREEAMANYYEDL